MSFARSDAWVWDFWLADDDHTFHLYYLFAPKALGDPELRHRHARIGHATSADLHRWTDHGEVLRPGGPGAFDETATWTGSVVQGDDGLWRMYYTGSVFTAPGSQENIESIGVATSSDLHHWDKQPDMVLRADARWYETLGDSDWPEEAWRDPWVFRDPAGRGWHMLITARSRTGRPRERGVVGHAWSADLKTWDIRPPLSTADSGFGHLEVLQIAEIGGKPALIFSATADSMADGRPDAATGVWVVDEVAPLGPFPVADAVPLTGPGLYSGRIIQRRDGTPVLLGFENTGNGAGFLGVISDPVLIGRDPTGRLEPTRGLTPAALLPSSASGQAMGTER